MKKHIYNLSFLLGFSFAVYGQASYTLSTPDAVSKSYIARDYVRFTSGYSFQATSGKNLYAGINERILIPAQYQTTNELPNPNRTLDINCPVGAGDGTAVVTISGGASYQIPIELPIGTNELQPSISISYNSQSGNSILGYSWSLAALSMISRTGKTIYHDNSVSAPNLSATDNLILDGQRLMLVSGGNFTSGAIYGSEIETYSEITYKWLGSYLCFEIKTKDGSILEYGSTGDSYIEAQNSSIPVAWLLSKVTDKNGNYMTYSYQENNSTGEFYIKSIDYTGNLTTGVSPVNKVEFFYETRNDVEKSYIAGKKLSSSVILKKIKTTVSGVTNRIYQFNYFYDGFYSKLTEIAAYSSENVRYNSTTIDWGDYYGEYSRYGSEDLAFLSEAREGTYPIFADFDGDGKTDMLSYPTKSTYTSSDVATLYLAYSYYGMVGFSKKCTIPLAENFKGFLVADMDGDGKNDAIRISLAPNGTYRYNYYMYDGNNMTYNYLGFNTDSNEGLTGDFNGDGKMEILIKSNQQMYNGTGSMIASGGIDDWGIKYAPIYPNNLYMTDFNGNGKTDILVMNSTGYWVYELNGNTFSRLTSFSGSVLTNSYFTYPGDFNGDGKTDILAQYAYNLNTTFILFSTGNTFEKQDINIPELQAKPFVSNCNKDGKSEIAFLKARSSGNIMDPQLGIYNGSGFTIVNNTSTYIDRTKIREDGNALNMCLSDFDGDGRAEICLAGYSDACIISYLCDPQNLLVKSITDGMNRTTSYEYATVSDDTGYTETGSIPSTFPIIKSKIPLTIVKSLTTMEGNSYSSTYYNYKDLRMHQQGKGFLCFGEVTATDYTKGQKMAMKYNYNSYYYFPYVTEQITSTTSGSLISTITNSSSYVYVGNKRIFPYISTQVLTNHLTGVTKTTSMSNMQYGNPLTVTKSYGGGISETLTTSYINVLTGGKRILGLPENVQTVKVRNGQSWIDKSVIEYNGQYLPSKKITYTKDGTMKTGEESYTYDAFGNRLTTATKTYNSATWLTTTCEYSADGRFLTKKTDPTGLVTEYGYNIAKGWIVSAKDHRGNATAYEYDNFGRQARRMNADGTIETSSIMWTSSPSGALYYIVSTATGKPTVKTYYDGAGREIRTSQGRFDGAELKTDKAYNTKGQLYKVSLPFKGSTATLWNTYQYDAYNRTISLTYASGKTDSWSYSNNSVTITKDGMATTKNYDGSGKLISSVDPGGTLTYSLRPDGQPTLIINSNNTVSTTFTYDNYGRQTSINDPSAGLQSYEYNDNGNIYKQTDANNNAITLTYDGYQRLTNKTYPEFSTTYNYNSDGLPESVVSTNGTSKTFTYDNYGRLTTERENAPDNKWLQKTYTYGQGNVQTVTYTTQSGNIATENLVYVNGHKTEIKLNGQTTLWKLDSENEAGLPTQVSTGNITRTYGYDTYGLPVFRIASSPTVGTFYNQSYNFDPISGNMNWRKDNRRDITENFGYDGLNRLTDYGSETVEYSDNGNIISMSATGQLEYYNATKPYAVTGLTRYTESVPLREQNISYTSFKRPYEISENDYNLQFTYNGAADRVRMQLTNNGIAAFTRYYLGQQYEIEQTSTGTKERLYLGGDAYSAPAIYIKENNVWNIYYICRDYQGSIVNVIKSDGSWMQELSYDPWGRLRNPVSQDVYMPNNEPVLFLGRGYTGHEHLPWSGLINMNARLYDPALGRFLSPDPYVQAPDFTQNFNRYSYCLNNPLKYSDPSGEFISTIITAIVGFGEAIVKGVIAPWFVGFDDTAKAGKMFENAWKDYGKQVSNAWKIDMGLFHTDPNKSIGGQIWELTSRFTWQLPQTILGNLIMTVGNLAYKVDNVTYGYGVTVVDMGTSGAITVGNYTAGPKGYTANWRDHLFVHEYGHYIQSQQHGIAYLLTVGIPSLQSAIIQKSSNPSSPRHHDRWFEADASYKGAAYFDKYYGSSADGYFAGSPSFFDRNSFINNGYSPYMNSRNGFYNYWGHSVTSKFHWTDPVIYLPLLGLIPALFY